MESTVLNIKRGGKLLRYKGYLYERNKYKNGKTYWRCSERCGAWIVQHENGVIPSSKLHSHEPKIRIPEKYKFIENLRRRVAEDRVTSIPKIYREEFEKVSSPEIAAVLPSLASIKSSLYRARASVIPPLPKSLDELKNEQVWTKTKKNEDLLLADDGTGKNCILHDDEKESDVDEPVQSCSPSAGLSSVEIIDEIFIEHSDEEENHISENVQSYSPNAVAGLLHVDETDEIVIEGQCENHCASLTETVDIHSSTRPSDTYQHGFMETTQGLTSHVEEGPQTSAKKNLLCDTGVTESVRHFCKEDEVESTVTKMQQKMNNSFEEMNKNISKLVEILNTVVENQKQMIKNQNMTIKLLAQSAACKVNLCEGK